jgi:cytochrome c-type biogenesis protein
MGLRLLDLVDIPLPSFEFNLPSSLTTATSTVNQSAGTGSADNDIMSSVVSFDEDGNMVPPMMNQDSENDTSNVSNNSNSQGGGAGALFRTFLLGGSSALVASPCATPVLTSILAYVAASRDPTLGTALLVTYTLGYSTPLLVVGATGGEALARAADASSEDSIIGKIGSLVNPLTAGVLIWYGTTGLLTGFFGDPSVAGLAPILD